MAERNEIPRRACMDLWSPGERAIYDAMVVLEREGAGPLLTDAVILLGQARAKVADHVDAKLAEATRGREAAPCVTCGQPPSGHRGVERFCPTIATYRRAPAMPITDHQRGIAITRAAAGIDTDHAAQPSHAEVPPPYNGIINTFIPYGPGMFNDRREEPDAPQPARLSGGAT